MLNNINFVTFDVFDEHNSFFCHFQSELLSKVWCYSEAFDWFSCLNLKRTMFAYWIDPHCHPKLNNLSWLPPCLWIKTGSGAGKMNKHFFQKSEKGLIRTVQCKISLSAVKMLLMLKVSMSNLRKYLLWRITRVTEIVMTHFFHQKLTVQLNKGIN